MDNNNNNNVIEEKEIKPKKNKSLLLIIIGIVLLIGVGCFILLQQGTNKNTSKDDGNEEQETEDEPIIQVDNLELSKCLNCSNFVPDTAIKITDDLSELKLLNVLVRKNKKIVEIRLSSNVFKMYGHEVKDRTIIKQFDKKIKQVLIASYANDLGGLTISYLMEDGTVQYTKVIDEIKKEGFDNLNDEDIFNTKVFKDVKDAVKLIPILYDGELLYEDAYSILGVIAIKKDGYFYNLDIYNNNWSLLKNKLLTIYNLLIVFY